VSRLRGRTLELGGLILYLYIASPPQSIVPKSPDNVSILGKDRTAGRQVFTDSSHAINISRNDGRITSIWSGPHILNTKVEIY